MSTINDDSIEIFNANTGEKLKLQFNKIDEKTLEIAPESGFKEGEEYYFVINEHVKDKDGNGLTKPSVVKVTCSK